MTTAKLFSQFNLSEQDLINVDEYRKKKNSAVLTIMFTDIQGFTSLTEEKGEAYVHSLTENHNKILTSIIEENNAGIIIKFIGDAIMAVFAEPTAAVEKALKIQDELARFNKFHPDLDDIKVRIGLHMGQTVIENKIRPDLFGRHVNRASRIEGLSSGGHVYMSYTVFDSVKSWILDSNSAEYVLHGSYFLKGIKKPEEIYEVYNKNTTKPQAPKKGKKKRQGAAALVAVALIVVTALIVGLSNREKLQSLFTSKKSKAVQQMQTFEPGTVQPRSPIQQKAAEVKPEVYFKGLYATEAFLDFKTPLATKKVNDSSDIKKALTDISAGKHLIHYNVTKALRYFAEISVKNGKNTIPLNFAESRLPAIQINYSVPKKSDDSIERKNENNYMLYTKNSLKKLQHKAAIQAKIHMTKTNKDSISYTVSYILSLDGNEKAKKEINLQSNLQSKERTGPVKEIIYEDNDHYYFIEYSYKGKFLQFAVSSAFIEYK